jgi:hypothetical protein
MGDALRSSAKLVGVTVDPAGARRALENKP